MLIAIKRFKQLMGTHQKQRTKITSIDIASTRYQFRWSLIHVLIYSQDNNNCVCCGTTATHIEVIKTPKSGKNRVIIQLKGRTRDGLIVPMTVDHIIPKARGGAKNSIQNVQIMCVSCNQTKSNTLPSEEIMGVERWWKNRIPHILKQLFDQEQVNNSLTSPGN